MFFEKPLNCFLNLCLEGYPRLVYFLLCKMKHVDSIVYCLGFSYGLFLCLRLNLAFFLFWVFWGFSLVGRARYCKCNLQ